MLLEFFVQPLLLRRKRRGTLLDSTALSPFSFEVGRHSSQCGHAFADPTFYFGKLGRMGGFVFAQSAQFLSQSRCVVGSLSGPRIATCKFRRMVFQGGFGAAQLCSVFTETPFEFFD